MGAGELPLTYNELQGVKEIIVDVIKTKINITFFKEL